MIGKPLAAFTRGDASTLIDLLKHVKAGDMGLQKLCWKETHRRQAGRCCPKAGDLGQ